MLEEIFFFFFFPFQIWELSLKRLTNNWEKIQSEEITGPLTVSGSLNWVSKKVSASRVLRLETYIPEAVQLKIEATQLFPSSRIRGFPFRLCQGVPAFQGLFFQERSNFLPTLSNKAELLFFSFSWRLKGYQNYRHSFFEGGFKTNSLKALEAHRRL